MANKITLIRIISLPLLIFFLSSDRWVMALLALLTFILLAITDWLDGYVARNIGQVTGMGKLLDPIADKLLVMTAMLPLIGRGIMPAWLGILILGREFIVNGIRMVAASDRKIISAGKWGKVKTVVYIVALSIIIGSPIIPPLTGIMRFLGFVGLLGGLALAIVSAVEYFLDYTPSDPGESGTDSGK